MAKRETAAEKKLRTAQEKELKRIAKEQKKKTAAGGGGAAAAGTQSAAANAHLDSLNSKDAEYNFEPPKGKKIVHVTEVPEQYKPKTEE